jgi:tetratricopeptide (TPR) repeat protein
MVHGSGASVIYGNCEEGLGMPYQPWISALGQLIEHADEALLRDFVESKGLSLALLLPDLARRLSMAPPAGGSDADADRFLILEGVARLLALASQGSPLVVVLDDLHWVDAASLQMLRHLVASALPMSVLVVGTFRDSDLSRAHPLTGALADLRRESCVDRLDLVGLEDVEIIDLLEAAAGHDMPDEGVALAHALRRDTSGNPFFVVEVIRHLAENGSFVLDQDGRWSLSVDLDDLDLPTSVREVVAHRVARLGVDKGQALSLASVIGRDFDIEVLAALVGSGEDHILDVLETAIGAGLVSEADGRVGHYRFVHALIQHTLYADLSATRRQRAHQKVAEYLEASDAGESATVAELARHWTAATRPTDLSKALLYSHRAGDVALAGYAPLDSIDWYTKALELLSRQVLDDDNERCSLLVGLGTAERQAGQPQHHQTLVQAARLAQALGDEALLVAAALGAARGAGATAGDDTDQIDVVKAALAAVGHEDGVTRAQLLSALAEATDAREWERRRDLAAEAVHLARGLDDITATDVMRRTYPYRTQPETSAQRLVETEEAVAVADRGGDPLSRFWARNNRVHSCMEVGDLAEVDARLDEMQRLVEQTGLPYEEWSFAISRCWRLTLSGDLVWAESANDGALEIGTRIGTPEAVGAYGGQLFAIRQNQGRLEEIVDFFAQAAAENPSIAVLRVGVIKMHCELGHFNEARALFEPEFASGFRDFPRDNTWTTSMASCADSAADLQHRAAARVLFEELRPFADYVVFNQGTVNGALDRSLGRLAHLLGDHDEAELLFRSALEINERIESPFWIARTELDYADLLTDRTAGDDPADTEVLASQALATARERGYAALERRAQLVLGHAH